MALTTKQENQLLRILRELIVQKYGSYIENGKDLAQDIFGYDLVTVVKKIINGTDAQKLAIIDAFKTYLYSNVEKIEAELLTNQASIADEKQKLNEGEWE